jgi:hypothetical protein
MSRRRVRSLPSTSEARGEPIPRERSERGHSGERTEPPFPRRWPVRRVRGAGSDRPSAARDPFRANEVRPPVTSVSEAVPASAAVLAGGGHCVRGRSHAGGPSAA